MARRFCGLTRRRFLRWVTGTLAAGAPLVLRAAEGGFPARQVTTEEYDQSNIYCETPYCSRDSRWFVYARTNPALRINRTELMAVELGTWKQERLDTAHGLGGLAISSQGVLYYLKSTGQGELELVRADLGKGTPEVVYRRRAEPWIRSLGTVSYDGRYYAGGVVLSPTWDNFGIVVVDLEEGREFIVDQDPFILNPHPQFDPGPRYQLMIQHNRGGKFSPEGKLERLVGEEGATLYVLSVPEGRRTTLPIGKPFTTPCTGHEAWIGTTGEMLFTVSWSGDFSPEKGNLLGIRPGGQPRVVARGYRFNHVGTSRCGRLFSADDSQPPFKIVIGNTRTGTTAVVCESQTKPDGRQNTHVHPYLTPDLKWVIFNSNRTGFPHVYAAPVSEGTLARVLEGTAG